MTVRWVEESDPVRRNAAAGGYVAAEGHLVVPERSRTLQNDESDEPPGSSDHEDVEDHHEDHEEEDDDAAAPRTVPPRGAHVRSYHVVYSKSYGCPVLLVRGVSCEPGGRVMGHAETEASLVAAATRGAEGGAEEERRRRAVSLPIVDGERGNTTATHRVCAVGASARAWRGLGRRAPVRDEERDGDAPRRGRWRCGVGVGEGTCRRGSPSSPPPSPTFQSRRTG